jgi:transcriptional regulator GlxA family with amidase domain
LQVAIVTFDGFNELDSFVALGLINRLKPRGWSAELACPAGEVTSMNGVVVQAQRPLEFANDADIVLFGSGIYTRAVAENSAMLDRLRLDPLRQLVGGQCSGTLLLARLGLLGDMPACTDTTTKPWVVQAGVVVVDEPFRARGPIATAGGCMASVYLAAWAMWRGAGRDAAAQALHYVAPVGEKHAFVERVLGVVEPFMPQG